MAVCEVSVDNLRAEDLAEGLARRGKDDPLSGQIAVDRGRTTQHDEHRPSMP